MKKLEIRGNIALTTVIVLSAVLLSAGMTLLLTSADLAISSRGFLSVTQMDIVSDSCYEESLYRLKFNHSYSGTFTVTQTTASCQATVTIDLQNANYRDITIDTTLDTYHWHVLKKVDVSQTPFLPV